MLTSRRGFIAGLGALFVAPAIVRASSIMPVKVFTPEIIAPPPFLARPALWMPCDGRLLKLSDYPDVPAHIRLRSKRDGAPDGHFFMPDLTGGGITHANEPPRTYEMIVQHPTDEDGHAGARSGVNVRPGSIRVAGSRHLSLEPARTWECG